MIQLCKVIIDTVGACYLFAFEIGFPFPRVLLVCNERLTLPIQSLVSEVPQLFRGFHLQRIRR